jgi:prepilin-type N-terminal cleavage/methylation domain-containing protein
MKNRLNLSGFSLIEMLVYMAILSIISTIVWLGIQWMQAKDIEISTQQKIYTEANNAVQTVKKSIETFEWVDGVAVISTSSDHRCLKIKDAGYLFSEDSKTHLFSLNVVGSDCLITSKKSALSGSIFQLGTSPPFDVTGSKNFLVKFNFKIAATLNKPYNINFYQARSPLIF